MNLAANNRLQGTANSAAAFESQCSAECSVEFQSWLPRVFAAPEPCRSAKINNDMDNNITENKTSAIDTEQKKSALYVSLDTRQFEIGLYWKRATYFWAFIAATFTGYILVLSKANDGNEKTIILYLLNCMGIFTSSVWCLELKGSKYWQENWEKHVSDKEAEVHGEVFNKIITLNNHSILGLKSYPFSVSKLNLISSIKPPALLV